MHLELLFKPTLDLPRLAQILDELGHVGRLDSIRRWGKKEQAILFDAAQGFRKLTLDDFVPPSIDGAKEVIHHGKNTLPAFTHFQKRFCKPATPEEEAKTTAEATKHGVPEGPELWGYNHQDFDWATGPGYFVVHQGEGEGEIDIDYRAVPASGVKLPSGWPDVVPNSTRLGGVVYGGMIDVMRGVSTHVSIGRAKKPKLGASANDAANKAQYMDAWFVLCREDP